MRSSSRALGALGLVAAALAAVAGCQMVRPAGATAGLEHALPNPSGPVPSELNKTTLQAYVIEPPDILLVEAVKLVPKAPYRIESLDVLQVSAVPESVLQDQPINANLGVDPSGTIDLGPAYGRVNVSGLTLDGAIAAIERHLKAIGVAEPQVSVTLVQSAGVQRISDEHLVTPDGTINLGTYGKVYVAGLTLDEARAAIEGQLKEYLEEPKVSVQVYAYNSKVYYVITEGAGFGDQVARIPATGNETVLDAIAQINGLSRLSSKRIWIARPAPAGMGCDQVLPVNWAEITKGAATATNYQVLPGDRIFIAENKFIALDSVINNVKAPFERIFGFSLLGAQTIQTFNRFPDGQNGQGGGNFF